MEVLGIVLWVISVGMQIVTASIVLSSLVTGAVFCFGKSACANLIVLVESACVGLDCPSRGRNCRFTLVIECMLEKDARSRLVCPR